jgi:hypothetical protein
MGHLNNDGLIAAMRAERAQAADLSRTKELDRIKQIFFLSRFDHVADSFVIPRHELAKLGMNVNSLIAASVK